MEKFNYQTICYKLLRNLPPRTKEILERRFGLRNPQKETLEAIGQDHGITRERVRQIEEDGLEKIKTLANRELSKPFQYFISQFQAWGSLRREDALLTLLGGPKFKNHVFFLLTLGENFERFPETRDFYSLWTIDRNSWKAAQKVINSFIAELKKRNQTLPLPACLEGYPVLPSYVEISKHVLKGPEGLYGLRDWPEINPRSIKDKAYIVVKKENRPLHFTEVARLIDKAQPQTVHNELIKDSRFVLVGRGFYALQEWGYIPGQVREVIWRVLKEAKEPLPKEEIVERVLKQRLVKENTILLNLNNKKYFLKDSQGRYTIREA